MEDFDRGAPCACHDYGCEDGIIAPLHFDASDFCTCDCHPTDSAEWTDRADRAGAYTQGHTEADSYRPLEVCWDEVA
jgi:hypothetical protein